MRHWVKTAHKKARQLDVPNYMGARVQVVSQLKVKQWKISSQLNRVCDYIEFGFLLSLGYENLGYNTQVKNHASAENFPQAVDDFLKTKGQYKAKVSPFDQPPFRDLHVSPMMTLT